MLGYSPIEVEICLWCEPLRGVSLLLFFSHPCLLEVTIFFMEVDIWWRGKDWFLLVVGEFWLLSFYFILHPIEVEFFPIEVERWNVGDF